MHFSKLVKTSPWGFFGLFKSVLNYLNIFEEDGHQLGSLNILWLNNLCKI